MRREVIEIGDQAKDALVRAEIANDEGTAAAAELLALLLRARVRLKLAAQAEADMIQKLGHAVAGGLGFRDTIVGVHDRLGSIAASWGIEDLGDGGGKRVALPEHSNIALPATA